MTARERHRAEVVERDPFVCSLADEKCVGLLAADHILRVKVIERRRAELIRRLGRGEALAPAQRHLCETDMDTIIADARNGWLLCELHHGVKDRKLLTVPPEKLPLRFWQFAADYGLETAAWREGLRLTS